MATAAKRTAAVATGVGAVALTASILSVYLATPTPPTITLAWDNAPETSAACLTEIWSCTNLSAPIWTLKTSVPGTQVKIPKDKAAEFFIARNRDTNTGLVSDWCRHTN